jgi:hypothetical protein
MRIIEPRDRFRIAGSLLALLLAGCATTTAPRRWLPDAAGAQQEAFGGWITIQYRTDEPELQRYDGELIAVSLDSVYVLCGDTLQVVPLVIVEKAKVMAYNAHSSTIGAWTFLGCLSTISHGFYAGVTAPLWLLGGGCATVSLSRQPQVVYENPFPGSATVPTLSSWIEMQQFARFPFGLPPDLDRKSLKPKIAEPLPEDR